MKTKGYISVFTLIISILVFSLITVILIGVDLENNLNRNQKDYYQNCLISESVANKIKYDKNYIDQVNMILQELSDNKSGKLNIKVDYSELNNGNTVNIAFKSNKDNKYIANYNIKYKNTFTTSSISFSLKDNPILKKEERININEEDEIYKILINNSFKKIRGDMVFFAKDGSSYYLDLENYNKLVDEFNESEEDLDIFEILISHSTKLNYDELYFFNMDSLNILGFEDIELKGIFLNNRDIAGENKINLKGILINQNSNFSNFNVKGKVFEENNFNGNIIYEYNILREINDNLKIQEEFQFEKYWII